MVQKIEGDKIDKYDINIDKRSKRGTVALLLVMTLIHGSFIIFYVSLFISLYYKIYWILVVLATLMLYQFSPYCTRQVWFINLLQVDWMYRHFKDYTCTFEEPLQDEKCLLAAHPHGILDFAFIMNMYKYYPSVSILGSRMLLSIPLNGIFIRWIGASTVDPQNMKKLMKQGKNIGLIPGGFEEATLTSTKQQRIFLKNRKGFIKYALKYGYNIYPMFVFGENQIYNVFEPLLDFRIWLNKFKIPAVLFWSRFGIYPSNSLRLNTVVGKPLKCPQIAEPTKQQVEEYHQKYVQAITDLYNKNKEKYGEKSDLQIL